MPGGAAFVGTVLRCQQIGVELSPSFQLTGLTSTNALVLTIGVL